MSHTVSKITLREMYPNINYLKPISPKIKFI